MGTVTERSCSIGEAADLLGVSTAAVRKRVRRGKLAATKQEDGTWTVHLTDEDLVPHPPRNGHGTGDGTRDELVMHLSRENARLWDELQHVREEKAESDRRRDILLSQFTDQLQQLSATTSKIADTVVEIVPAEYPHETASRVEREPEPPPRSSWWARLFSL